MQIRDIMTRDVKLARPDQTIQEVARIMAEADIGFMPVGDDDRLVGMITDRDIAVRAVAEGHGCDTPVSDVMTREVRYCFDDEDADRVVMNMGDIQVRRLPVVDRDKRLVGVVSLADAALDHDAGATGIAFSSIVEPGGLHSQSASR